MAFLKWTILYILEGYLLTTSCMTSKYRATFGVDTRTTLPVIEVLHNVNSIQCGIRCTQDIDCDAYNMMKLSRTCEMIKGVPQIGDIMTDSDCVVYVIYGKYSKLHQERYNTVGHCSVLGYIFYI